MIPQIRLDDPRAEEKIEDICRINGCKIWKQNSKHYCAGLSGRTKSEIVTDYIIGSTKLDALNKWIEFVFEDLPSSEQSRIRSIVEA